MTVIVGVLCHGGVVLGTDSSATLGNLMTRTIEQSTLKIDVVDDCILVAGTGAEGLGQRFTDIVKQSQVAEMFHKQRPQDVVRGLSADAWKDFKNTSAPKQVHTNQGVYTHVDFGALLAFWKDGRPYLVEFGMGDFQPELKMPEGLWYASMGSGQTIADPFMGLMARTCCRSGPPSLATGRFITCWALRHTIDVNPGGIGPPARLAVLSKESGSQPRARLLTDDEVALHNSMVDSVYDRLAEFPDKPDWWAATESELPA